MQVFLPYPSFEQSVQVLDMKRLGKQRVECLQILNALEGRSKGWVNHPAVRMFRDYIPALKHYGWLACQEWLDRGCKDSVQPHFFNPEPVVMPWWIGGLIHETHRSNLVRKSPVYYGIFFKEDASLEYYWPVQ